MNKLLLALPLVLASTVYADDSETRDVSGFDRIQVRSGINLVVTQGDHYAVTVSTDKGDLDDVVTAVEGDRLIIGMDERRFWWADGFSYDDEYRVEVTLPALERLITSGGSNTEFTNEFTGDELDIRASGGSDIDFNGKYKELEVTTSGGADVHLAGTADELTLRTSGGSELNATKLDAQNADVRSSGSSSVRLTVHNSLIAHASGGSDVHYAGNPKETDIDESRNADISAR